MLIMSPHNNFKGAFQLQNLNAIIPLLLGSQRMVYNGTYNSNSHRQYLIAY